MKLVFLGFGTISKIIHKDTKDKNKLETIGIYDPFISHDNKAGLEQEQIKIYSKIEEITADKPDCIIEAASKEVAQEYVPQFLKKGIDVISLSVSAYLDEDIYKSISDCTGKLYIPSGAMPCIDAVRGAAKREIRSICLTTRKPPKALEGAAGIKENELENIQEPYTVFQGNAKDACELFPQNINIAATISLAGVGPERTKVKIVADPNVIYNTHSIEIIGEFGKYTSTIECKPSENPKTSFMAALSTIALVEKLANNIYIGN